MGFSYNVNVLNQKGSPALYTDTFANRPAAGYQGRLFIANDTSAIYEDTGTAWVLIANVSSGAGTLEQVTTNGNTTTKGISISAGGLSTNSLTDTALTLGSVLFAGAAGLVTQDNAAFFWDDTNNRLGINTVTPTNTLDLHFAGTTAILGLNNTAGNQAAILFSNTGTSKWRVGNTASNNLDFYNSALALTALSISGTNNSAAFNANILIAQGSTINQLAGYNGISGDSAGVYFWLGTSASRAYFVLNGLTGPRNYTLPDATGTLALTSNLASYLPLSGGTLTGPLSGTTLTLTGAATKLFLDGGSGSIGQNGINFTAVTGFTNAFYLYNGNSSGAFGFHLYDNTSAAYRFTVSNAGNFLIGSTTDDTINKLQVTGSGKFSSSVTATQFISQSAAGAAALLLKDASATNKWEIGHISNGLYFYNYTANNNSMFINSSGNVTFTNLAGTGTRTVLTDANGLLSAPVSDILIKENIEPLKYGLNTIMQLNAVQFKFIKGYKNYGEGLQIGAIAQEVEQIIPEAVFKTPSTGLKGIDYNQFNGIYIKAIQEQQKIIEGLIQRIEALENK